MTAVITADVVLRGVNPTLVPRATTTARASTRGAASAAALVIVEDENAVPNGVVVIDLGPPDTAGDVQPPVFPFAAAAAPAMQADCGAGAPG